MSIFSYLSYKKLFRNEILSRKKFNSQINFNSLAIAIGTQKTLISKVLLAEANFNSDQIYLACEFLGFNAEETEYVQLLLEYDRCVIAKRKKLLKEKISKIQIEKQRPAARSDADIINTESDTADFYLDPVAQLIHAFLIIPKFANNPNEICPILGIDREKLETSVRLLEKIGFVKKTQPGVYRVLKGHTHLSPTSPLYKVYHTLIRAKTMDQLMRLPTEKKYCFSVLLTSDEDTLSDLKERFLEFLKTAEEKVLKSKPEKVYQMNFDLFGWEP